MKNYVKEMYERKEYGWFAFYIFVVVVTARFAGAIGAIVSVLIVTGLYTVLKNQQYSVSKKIVLCILYVTGGIVAVLIAVNVFVGTISFFAGQRTADSLKPEFQDAQSRSLSDQPFTSSSTQRSTPITPSTVVNESLESGAYIENGVSPH